MKQTMKTLIVTAIAALLLATAALPALAQDFDFDTALSTFASTPANTVTLTVGETHLPNAAIWVQQAGGTCCSSDEAIVTVADNATVTAVSVGTAYVAIESHGMVQLYRYDVVSSVAETYPSFSPEQEALRQEYEDKTNQMWEEHNERVDAINQQAAEQREQILDIATSTMDSMELFAVIPMVLAILVSLAAIALSVGGAVYIFVQAPKCGMTRLWALVPLFSSVIT